MYHHCTYMFRIMIIKSLQGLIANSILMRRVACVKYLFCTYSVLMAPIFPLALPWASLNCSQNTSFLFRPLTVINIKRHLSKGFEMATLVSEHVAVEVGLHPLTTPLCYLTYEFNNLSCSLPERRWPYKLLLTISAGWNIIALGAKPQLSVRI